MNAGYLTVFVRPDGSLGPIVWTGDARKVPPSLAPLAALVRAAAKSPVRWELVDVAGSHLKVWELVPLDTGAKEQ